MTRPKAIIFLVLILCGALPLCAQTNPNLEIGLKPYGSFEGGSIDNVSITNGNLILHIPLLSYPQRGSLPGEIHLVYNDKKWTVNQTCFGSTCTDRWRWNPLGANGIMF